MKLLNSMPKNAENPQASSSINNSNQSDKKSRKEMPNNNELFNKPFDKPDKLTSDKQATKLELDGMNDLFLNNYFNAPNSLPQFLDRSGINPDFFLNSNNTNNGMPLESNFFPNFQNNMGSGNMQNGQNALNSNNNEVLNQNGLFLANNNFLLHNNLGLNNITNQPSNLQIYEDLVKNPGNDLWYQSGNQFPFAEKNFPGSNMFGENGSALMENPFFYPGIDDYSFKQGQEMNQQGNSKLNFPNMPFPNSNFSNVAALGNMGNLGNISNQLMLNNLSYNNDMNFLLPNLNFEDLCQLQLQSGNHPTELKVENTLNNYNQNKQNQNTAEMPPDNNLNGQDKNMLNMNIPSSMKPLFMGGDLEPQSNLLKFFPYIMGNLSNSNPTDVLGNGPTPQNSKNQQQQMQNSRPQQNQNSQMPQNSNQNQNQNNPNFKVPKNNSNSGAPNLNQQGSQQMNSMPNSSPNNNGSQNGLPDYNKLLGLNNYMPLGNMKSNFLNPEMDLLGRGFIDSLFMNNPGSQFSRGKNGLLDSLNFEDPFFMGGSSEMYSKMKEKNKFERSLKIEKYKNKKRNWAKKISYDCRKRVADTRLRIKGRFISKKDSEKINKLMGGKQEEAFNDKKNLNLDFITTKFNLKHEIETTQPEAPTPQLPSRANISKKELLNKIDEILNNKIPTQFNEDGLPIHTNDRLTEILKVTRKKIFKIRHIKPKKSEDRKEIPISHNYHNFHHASSEDKDLNIDENPHVNDYMYSNEANGTSQVKLGEGVSNVNLDENDNLNSSSNEENLQDNNNSVNAINNHRLSASLVPDIQNGNNQPLQQDEEIESNGVDIGVLQNQEETASKDNISDRQPYLEVRYDIQ